MNRTVSNDRARMISFVALLATVGLGACAGPSGSEGPPPPPPVPASPHRIAVVRLGDESGPEEVRIADLKEGMKLYQFTEGAYYTLETIDLGGDADSAPTRAEEAIKGGAELVIALHPEVLRALATRELGRPVVFGVLGDPFRLGAGDAADRHRPGLVGAYNAPPSSKLLTLVKYYLPQSARVGVLFDEKRPTSTAHKDALARDASAAGLEIVAVDVAGDAAIAIDRLKKEPVDAVCLADGLGPSALPLIEAAGRAKLPVFGHREDQVLAGAIAAEVPRPDRVGLEAGRMAYRVLGGEKPDGIPIARIDDTEPLVNPKVAANLGIDIPPGALRISRVVGGEPTSSPD